MRVLLVEDNEMDLMLIRRQLNKYIESLELTNVLTLAQLKEKLSESWDVIISDAHLPDGELPDIALEIAESGNPAPFVICSGSLYLIHPEELAKTPHIIIEKGSWPDLMNALITLGASIKPLEH